MRPLRTDALGIARVRCLMRALVCLAGTSLCSASFIYRAEAKYSMMSILFSVEFASVDDA